MEELDTLLAKLTIATGVAYNGNIKEVINQILLDYKVDAHIENDGSVIGSIQGKGKSGVMLACHIDEIGFMVSAIDNSGRISFSSIGGVDVRILPGQEVIVYGKKPLRGYIGAKPPHLMTREERKKTIPMDKLFVDLGIGYSQVKEFVRVGDYISFVGMYKKMKGALRSVKSLDNRASVACGLLVLKELTQTRPTCNIYFAATSQEEYTGLGAKIHSYHLPIDFAITIDVTFGEYPGLKEYEYFPLNKGPVIGRGATIPEKLYELVIQTAEDLKIPYQIEALPAYTGTDADSIAFNRAGIPTCVIGIPLRYMHTPVEIVSLKDIVHAKELIVGLVKNLNERIGSRVVNQ